MKGMNYLKDKLNCKRTKVLKRYRYYEQKNNVTYLSKLLPSEYAWMSETLGWCAKAVDSVADRLVFNEFRNDNFGLNELYLLNNRDILFDSACLSALIGSCAFIYISKDDDRVRFQVIEGDNATGIIDPITNLLTEGYAVLERNEDGEPVSEAYFTAGETWYYEEGEEPYCITNTAPYAALVPIIYKPDAKRPFGHSRISRACMDLTQSAIRTLIRSEISAEFYAFPQKYVTGLSEESEFNGKIANFSNFLSFYKDSDGDKPSVGQFNSGSMSPHTEQLRQWASLFAGETGLSLDDLGFVADNPSSADAIRASHEQLRLMATKAQTSFGTGFLNAGYIGACMRDNEPYERTVICETNAVWKPIFALDTSSFAALADGIYKLNDAFPGYFTAEKVSDLLGM